MLINIACFLAGAIVIGVIANRRPQWFAHVVTMANSIDNKVNTTVAPIVQSAVNKVQ